MPKEFSRTRRIGEQIQRELAQLIHDEIKDPRVGMVTVNSVDVSKDLGHAKVYVTSLENRDHAETIKALSHAAGFLRRELGRRLMIRAIPQLHFFYDESIERGSRLSALIDEAVESDKAKSTSHTDEDNDDKNETS